MIIKDNFQFLFHWNIFSYLKLFLFCSKFLLINIISFIYAVIFDLLSAFHVCQIDSVLFFFFSLLLTET